MSAFRRRVVPKCFFVALIFGWVVAIFLPSAVIAAAGLSPVAAGKSPPMAVFEVADEVAPAAKIGFVLAFAALLLAARRAPIAGHAARLFDMLAAPAAMLLVLALLPAPWSRGFGIGLSGQRFDPLLLAIYLAGAALAGLTFTIAERHCLARTLSASPPAGSGTDSACD